ncbi:diphosphomevalonate decarboxylase [Lacticigenium naphthae]|uniref:diphosphomevalonate decarboxylase n=1 Tax=Lacticigenium naphthae TaxID=515351 RepID=UPI00041B34BE|nr:diphosphomevalonate decarboxylase [Lacticigenium naphthae]
MITIKTVRAHTNIALIKYWGKKDEELIIPMNSSLSLTLDAFYTDTSVSFSSTYEKDTFYLNGIEQDEKAFEKLKPVIQQIREWSNVTSPLLIESYNHVPTAAGLASSASGMAALAGAASLAAGLTLTQTELSRLARLGSGSATRSIFGGFAEWQKGTSDKDSYAIPIAEADWDIGMIFLILNKNKKKISSREAMQRAVNTSPYYSGWLESTAEDIEEMKLALAEKNFTRVGELTEASALKMHALNFSASPPFTYWEPETLQAMKKVESLREKGFSCFYTMDAGPNVKVLCRLSEAEALINELKQSFNEYTIVLSKPGRGIEEISSPNKEVT